MRVPFGLAVVMLLMMPTSVGFQDLASLVSQHPDTSARWRHRLLGSPFGAAQAAVFNLPQPVGTAIPNVPLGFRLASYSPSDPDITGSIPPADAAPPRAAIAMPTVNRAAKGDRLLPTRPPETSEPDTRESELAIDPQADVLAALRETPQPAPQSDELAAALRVEPFLEFDVSLSLELHPQPLLEEIAEGPATDALDPSELDAAYGPDPVETPNVAPSAVTEDATPAGQIARLFFGDIGGIGATIEPWESGEEPILMLPRAQAAIDPDIKKSALAPPSADTVAPEAAKEGVTIAGKGEVTGDDRRPKTPAERLALSAKARVKAEKCLANAVYFESRGEPVRGQIAVAQVVMNRVFSGYYPNDVCGVVYQNAHRHLACQFTFACDRIADVVTEPEAWERAKRIAKETLDGKLWLKEVGKATHYHAYWVRPRWVREMRKLHKIGVHTFYRPRYWGDGLDAPSWGDATATAEAAAKL